MDIRINVREGVDGFGERLSIMMALRGYTQAKLADEAGIARQAVSLWVLGKGHPTYEKLAVICDVLDCTTDFLIRGL